MAVLKETALNFGPSGGMVGILTNPRPGLANGRSDLAVVILNAGVIHRVGPNRLHVRLARAVASKGTTCLRFDLPGIGDSRALESGGSVAQSNIAGMTAAFDLLERKGVASRFVVFGLCSGADHAFMAGCADQRVVGIALLDPTRVFPTWKSRTLRLLRWIARPASWIRLMGGRYRLLERLRQKNDRVMRDDGVTGPAPSVEETRLVEQALTQLVARRVRICYLITGDQRHRYNYRRQFLDAFPDLGLEPLTVVEIFHGANHTLAREADRARLEARVVDWVADSPFPTPSGESMPQEGRRSSLGATLFGMMQMLFGVLA